LIRTVGAVLLLGAVLCSTPPGRAATGAFRWTDGETGVPRQLLTGENETPVLLPPNEKCFDTFGAISAKNLTDSDAVLAKDGLCSELLIVLKPGESYDGPFGSVGFTPPGATDS
jgi:hypothetical protein